MENERTEKSKKCVGDWELKCVLQERSLPNVTVGKTEHQDNSKTRLDRAWINLGQWKVSLERDGL